MEKSQIAFVANALGPCQYLSLIAERFSETGEYDVRTCFEFGKEPLMSGSEFYEMMKDVSVVVVGMSPVKERAKYERLAIEMVGRRHDGIVIAVSDVCGSWNREWLYDLHKHFTAVSVVDEEEVSDAEKLFPNRVFVATPTSWRNHIVQPTVSGEEVRKWLGLEEKKSAILMGLGSSSPLFNKAMMLLVMEGRAYASDKPAVYFSAHPGDPEAATGYSFLTGTNCHLLRKGHSGCKFSTTELIAGVDMFADFGSPTMISALVQEVPVIGLTSSVVGAKLEELIGRRTWPFHQKLHPAMRAEDPLHLGYAIEHAQSHNAACMEKQNAVRDTLVRSIEEGADKLFHRIQRLCAGQNSHLYI